MGHRVPVNLVRSHDAAVDKFGFRIMLPGNQICIYPDIFIDRDARVVVKYVTRHKKGECGENKDAS